jgi:hypothetical protein
MIAFLVPFKAVRTNHLNHLALHSKLLLVMILFAPPYYAIRKDPQKIPPLELYSIKLLH